MNVTPPNAPDYGSDPLGDGQFRMVPSGDIVDRTERDNRLKRKRDTRNDCLGMSWDEIEQAQGGKIKHL